MLNRLFNYKKEAHQLKKSFAKHSIYFKPGTYILNENLKIIYRNDKDTIKFVKNVVLKNNRNLINGSAKNIKTIIKRLIVPRKVKIKYSEIKTGIKFDGTIYLPANTTGEEKDVKIFNFKTMEIVTIYTNSNGVKNKIDTYKFFKSYFKIPRILSYDINNQITIEELVISKPKNEWNKNDYKKVIDCIFTNYKHYILYCSEQKKYTKVDINKLLKEIQQDEILLPIAVKLEKNILKYVSKIEFPAVKQHGDLWLYNILLEQNSQTYSCYFIDWEHAGEYVFFYDLFWWMQNEALYNNDYSYIEKYVSGGYDHHFKDIFEGYGIKFNNKLRFCYFNIAILEIVNKRILDKEDSIKKTVIDLYMPLLRKIETMNIPSNITS